MSHRSSPMKSVKIQAKAPRLPGKMRLKNPPEVRDAVTAAGEAGTFSVREALKR